MTVRVLLVDDDFSKEILADFLADLDVCIDFSETGVEACAKALKTNYDVIFMDIIMPDMNGIEATRYLRKNLAANKQPKIVASTGNAIITRKGHDQLAAAGFDDVLIKPYTEEMVYRVFSAWLPNTLATTS
ncbi:MAG TPA: hypothetical protein DE179_05450 [Oceanospirillaceae bacterium]|nr:hypothetical protein [Oceanospirillaceae bacterium]